jgi:hypothetical protein
MHVLVGKPHTKKPLGKLRHRLKYNIKIDLEMGQKVADWINVAQ